MLETGHPLGLYRQAKRYNLKIARGAPLTWVKTCIPALGRMIMAVPSQIF